MASARSPATSKWCVRLLPSPIDSSCRCRRRRSRCRCCCLSRRRPLARLAAHWLPHARPGDAVAPSLLCELICSPSPSRQDDERRTLSFNMVSRDPTFRSFSGCGGGRRRKQKALPFNGRLQRGSPQRCRFPARCISSAAHTWSALIDITSSASRLAARLRLCASSAPCCL